ncbi:acyl-CoA dehydrogenase [Litorivicinus lipolyticus]|uniref:3-methylmercaptopropionyl-CoA dehydrogenase n=1 Tax=Litorivicinus lipolyticus TaxID=418701 RepID=A0A5Q2QF29_9GAMM|nr:acyl-CoA dehydrogenase [Litorivicinus lipolyticus]QGG79615.1 acyl-CoA dehydrogenase [Litorivicinus lipolyticus]
MTYQHPAADTHFVLEHLVQFDALCQRTGFDQVDQALADAVIEEAGRFASEVLAPSNRVGDQQPPTLGPNGVEQTPGFKAIYQSLAEAGWIGLTAPESHGGQGLPSVLGTAVNEIWQSANLALSLCPMLSQGAIEALAHHADDSVRDLFLPRLASGEWTGTMNLTEPDAGSDLAAIKARAEPDEDGLYRISGQKIYITWGDHQMTDNIAHLVLARLPDAPAGIKGISLFIVPKFRIDAEGNALGANAVSALSLEHKLGIHASPTCVMQYDGAQGYLVGAPHQGLKYMFTMMNHARQAVGVQGLAVSQRAYQQARQYASERVQGRRRDGSKICIIDYPDVRRQLLTMRVGCEAMRALALVASSQLDRAACDPESAALAQWYTPIVKGWLTELSVELTSLGVQVHGGMGYVEETGAAQYLRDARILPIYEGTTAIQALDLIGRKTLADQGQIAEQMIAQMRVDCAGDVLMEQAINTAEVALSELLAGHVDDPELAPAVAYHYLMHLGYLCGGWLMVKSARVAQAQLDAGVGDGAFLRAKINSAEFYGYQLLPRATAHAASMRGGSRCVMAMPREQL